MPENEMMNEWKMVKLFNHYWGVPTHLIEDVEYWSHEFIELSLYHWLSWRRIGDPIVTYIQNQYRMSNYISHILTILSYYGWNERGRYNPDDIKEIKFVE